jgi:hypothetical protein
MVNVTGGDVRLDTYNQSWAEPPLPPPPQPPVPPDPPPVPPPEPPPMVRKIIAACSRFQVT